MKKIFTTILFTVLALCGTYAQDQQVFSATIKQGSLPNTVMAVIKPNLTFAGQIVSFQFTFQIPSSVTPVPTASIYSNPLSTYAPTGSYVSQTTTEGGYTTYLFGGVFSSSPTYNFTAGTEINALEVQFAGGPVGVTSEVRLSHLADGGSTGQDAFYVQIGGNDYTNYTSMFYGSGSANGGSYSSYNYATISGVALPVKFSNFGVAKRENDGVLNWMVQNQTSNTASYSVERSFDAKEFTKIATINANLSTTSYNYTDAGVVATRNSGMIFYRIKQLDKDGFATYSEIKAIRAGKNLGLMVYPNPAKDVTTVTIDASEAGIMQVSLVDASGREVMTKKLSVERGSNQKSISLSGIAAGSYVVKVAAGDVNESAGIVIQ
jgi:hypothetical protein